MRHPTEEELLAYLDGELAASRGSEVAEHLTRCLPCHREVKELRATLDASAQLLRRIDAAEPERWGAVAVPHPPVRLRASGSRGARHVRGPWHGAARWAAGLVLLATAAAASATLLTHHRTVAPPPAVVEPAPAQSDVSLPAGAVIVRPSEDSVRIVVHGGGADVVIRAALHDSSGVRIAVEGVAAPRFAARDGLVEVTLEEPDARVQVWFPRTLRSGSVYADGRERVRVLDGSLRLDPGGSRPGPRPHEPR